jgi:hypothetical protein
MDRIVKQQILTAINTLTIQDLIGFVDAKDISLAEMTEAGLRGNLLQQLEQHYKSAAQIAENKEKAKQESAAKEGEILTICNQIENGKYGVQTIRNLILEGKVSEQQLLKHTSLNEELINKIKNYNKRSTDFQSWQDLPPLQLNRTDLYFFGQPGSGKSCILASIFNFCDKHGMIINNTSNHEGTKYMNQLKDEISFGILPDSTAAEGVNYIPIELRNLNDKKLKHPLNFIEMSGELFDQAYEGGISENNLAAKNYLNNNNQKLIFFVLDYEMHQKSSSGANGPTQSSKMQAILALLDAMDTLKKTDGIYIVLSKSDLFPKGIDRNQHALDFMNNNYKSFMENCKDLKEKYREQFKVIIYPFSIGEVKYQNLLTTFDETSPSFICNAIMQHTFAAKKSFLGKLFN